MTSTDIYSENSATIFMQKAKVMHEDKYNYEFVNYIHSKQKVKIDCPIHGIFHQTPNNHLSNHGCPICSIDSSNKSRTSNIDNFIQNAKSIHGGQYIYNEVNYINSRTKIKIECKTHGIFEQTPNNHLAGKGCKSCTNTISKNSTSWLKSLDIKDMILEYRLLENKCKAVDGYSPSTNTVYQFHGDYWHGNPIKYSSEYINPTSKISYGELYKRTIESDKWIISLGYNLITIWESDFNN